MFRPGKVIAPSVAGVFVLLASLCRPFECTETDPGCSFTALTIPALLNALREPTLLVALGKTSPPMAGEVWIKEPGKDWQKTLTTSTFVRDLGYASGAFYAVAAGKIHRSADGRNWQLVSNAAEFRSFAAGAGRLIVSASSGFCPYYSIDGISWTLSGCGSSDKMVAAFNGVNFMVAGDGDPIYSNDGLTWNNSGGSCAGDAARAISVGGAGRFVAVSPTGTVCTSSDAGVSAVGYTHALQLEDIIYHPNSGRFYAVGANTANGGIRSSLDGSAGSWSANQFGGGVDLFSVRVVTGALYAGGANGSIFRSGDGTSWNSIGGPPVANLQTYAVIAAP